MQRPRFWFYFSFIVLLTCITRPFCTLVLIAIPSISNIIWKVVGEKIYRNSWELSLLAAEHFMTSRTKDILEKVIEDLHKLTWPGHYINSYLCFSSSVKFSSSCIELLIQRTSSSPGFLSGKGKKRTSNRLYKIHDCTCIRKLYTYSFIYYTS